MQPFFAFYGGKWRIAPSYPSPEHEQVIEPFAGAAGYATRHADRRVTLIEADPQIAALWSYLIRVSPSEIARIPTLAIDETIDDLGDVAEEARTLVGFWLNKGTSAPRRSPSAWMRSGIQPTSFWGEKIRARIAAQVERIRHWRVIPGSFEEAPDAIATWFVDPPYEVGGANYRTGVPDFASVAAFVKSRRGLVIACEAEGASWLPFRPHVVAKANESRTGGKKSREAVYVQRDGREVAPAQLSLYG